VITSRSDTMDVVMMALIVLALLFLVQAAETGRDRWLLAAAATLGVAFDVKLLESLVAVPGLAVFAYLALQGPRRRRLARLAVAGVVYVVVALSWLTATLLVPAHERPFAIGSTNGSAWNAAFVFNGTERLGGKSPEPQFTRLPTWPPLPDGDAVRARPHPDRPPVGHAAFGSHRSALGRAAGPGAARGVAARHARPALGPAPARARGAGRAR